MASDGRPTRPRGGSRSRPRSGDSDQSNSGLPEGFLDIFPVSQLPSTHPEAYVEDGGKAIRQTQQQGFLCFGQYKKGYPTIPLKAFFSILIDDNFSDDRNILILDVYDHQIDRVIGKRLITRKDFPHAGEFSLFEFDFTPPGPDANMEFRIYYMGWAYVRADKIAVVNPAKVTVTRPEDILQPSNSSKPPVPSEYCNGNELICLPTMTPETVSQAGGRVVGGTFGNGSFRPSQTGGIEFTLPLDTSRPYCIECELEGSIPNWHLGEKNGGKTSLFTVREVQGNYYVSLQRMYAEYRGGGRFRVLLTDRADPVHQGAAWLLTIPDLSGDYTMRHWGNESHHLKMLVHGNRCQLIIDDFHSQWAIAPYDIGGQRQVNIMLGNREPAYLFLEEAALTHFTRFKVSYTG